MPFRDLYVVAASGDRPTRVTNVATEQGGVSDLVWAPDGESLFFSFSGGVYEVRRDGTGLERRVAPPGGKSSLAFSPDGKILAYLQEGDLYLWHRATNDLVRATKVARPRIGNGPLDTCCGPGFSRPDVELTSLSWSPDSGRIALSYADRSAVRTILIPNYLGEETRAEPVRRDYPGDNDHVRDLAIYSVDEGRFRRLELPDAADRGVASIDWSPDGSTLLVDQYPQSAKHRWLFLVNAETGARAGDLARPPGDPDHARTGPPLSRATDASVYFVSDVDGRHHLYQLAYRRQERSQADRRGLERRRGIGSLEPLRLRAVEDRSSSSRPRRVPTNAR